MKSGKKPRGYTILEVLIFLVITMVLLISALSVFQGQQQRTEFTQAMREMDARLRTIANEVGSGYFPNGGGVDCSASSEPNALEFDPSTDTQGTSENCIFMGKVVQFGAPSDTCSESGSAPCNQYSSYVVAGIRQDADGNEVGTLGDARPSLVARIDADDPVDFTETFALPGSMEIRRTMVVDDDIPTEIGAVGFLSSLASYGSGSDLVGGAQHVTLVQVPGSARGQSVADLNDDVHELQEGHRDPDHVTICVAEAGGDPAARQAALILGRDSNGLTTEVRIDNVPPECS